MATNVNIFGDVFVTLTLAGVADDERTVVLSSLSRTAQLEHKIRNVEH